LSISATFSENFSNLWISSAQRPGGRYSSRFSSFQSRFGKKYGSRAEEIQRFEKFSEKVADIDKHNEEYEKGNVQYNRDVNQFADMFENEKKSHTGLLNRNHRPKRNLVGPYTYDGISRFYQFTANSTEIANAPASLDWTTKGFTKAVDNQGQCGSCWAFAGGAAIDGAFKIQKALTTSQSQEELVDCTSDLGNYGCDGGFIDTPFQHVNIKGVTSNSVYPYTASTGVAGTCQTAKIGSTTKLSSYVQVLGTEDSVKAGLAKYGPCATSLDVENGLMSYKSGVYTGKVNGVLECSANAVNHAVVIVGYGTDATTGLQFWKIRNSWGTGWGESGHFRIQRNAGKLCGIAADVWCGVA